MKILVVSPEEAEKCEYLICVRTTVPAYFPDDLIGECCSCQQPVRYRPTSPKAPPRICMECALEQMEATKQ
jgi:hypothetical protein